MPSVFTCNAKTFKYKKTRRGINATCQIMKDGKLAATLHDVAEEIVATVVFHIPGSETIFLEEARANGFDMESVGFAISEYARKMTMDAEQAMLSGG